MFQEGLDKDFLSEDNSNEVHWSLSDDDFQCLIQLFNNLKSFDHIYINNIIIDMEVGQLLITLN